MLSPGEFYKSVPTDPEANLHFRRHVLAAAAKSRRLQLELIEACRRDVVFYVNAFVWQHNPKKFGDEVGPFVLFPFQERVLRRTLHRLYVEQQAMIWEKSRYQGATWLMLIKDDWLSLFHRHKSFLLISHTEDAVYEKDNPGSMMWKVEFMHRFLPDWLIRGAARRTSKKTLTFNFPATDSFINGGANTSRVGVGDRRSSVDLDEFAKQPNAADILSQTADTGPRLFVSTHYGVGTSFYQLTNPGPGQPDPVKEVMHWSDNPMQNAGTYRSDPGLADHDRPLDKTFVYPPGFDFVRDGKPHGGPFPGLRSPWYDEEVRERLRLGGTERDIASHIDIDVQGSTNQFFSQADINRIKARTCRPGVRYDVVVDPDANEVVRLDRLDAGFLWLWLELDHRGRPPEDDYAIGIDPAAGTGATPTCMTIASGRGEKVGAYVNPFVAPHEYAPVAVGLAKLFHGAFLIWETPGPGATLGQKVLDARYSRIYWKPKNDLARVKEATQRPGWHNQSDTATRLLRDYKAALVAGKFVNRCEFSLRQCLDYVYVGKDIEHTGRKSGHDDPSRARENHGDRVMADALAWLGLVASNRLAKRGEDGEPEAEFLHPSSLAARMAMAEAADTKRRPVASWLARLGVGR